MTGGWGQARTPRTTPMQAAGEGSCEVVQDVPLKFELVNAGSVCYPFGVYPVSLYHRSASDKESLSMNSFNWLHLSDLHVGMRGQDHLWPNIKSAFFDDLALMHERSGPWQAVFF